jgi:hypothetical protein
MRHMNPRSVSPQSMAPAEATTQIRALVVSADARYCERAQSVVGEVAGVAFALASPTGSEDVWWLVEHERANVVVLDATDCEAQVAEVVAKLATLAPALGVVVVCEHLTNAARELRALPKWGWTRDLRTAVQHAHIDGSPLAGPRTPWKAGRRDLRGAAPGQLSRR